MLSKKYYIGFLLIVILASSIYVALDEKVKIQVYNTKTIFSVWDGNSFEKTAYEYTRIFDGSKLMRAKNRTVNITNGTAAYWNYDVPKFNSSTNKMDYHDEYTMLIPTVIHRKASFKENIIVENFYEFDGDISNVNQVPIDQRICFTNAKGKIFEYLIRDLENTYNSNFDITSPFSFGKQMKVTFESRYMWTHYYSYKTVDNKIKIRYRIKRDYQCFDIRLFDPFGGADLYYKLENNESHLGAGPNLTEINGPIDYDPGILNNAFHADPTGLNPNLFSNPTTLTHTTELSINVWINGDDTPGGEEDLVHLNENAAGATAVNSITLQRWPNRTVSVLLRVSGDDDIQIGSNSTTTNSQDHMVTFILDGTNAKLFLDSIEESSITFSKNVERFLWKLIRR